MTVCQRCPAGIRFVTMTATGRPMPVDPTPDDFGNIAATPSGRDYTNGRYLVAGEQPADGEVRLRPHFMTCTAPGRPGRPVRRPATPTALF